MREIQVGGARAKYRGIALVDDEDYGMVAQHNWSVATSPTTTVVYAIRSTRRPDGSKTSQRMHHLILGQLLIDHIDMNGLNNQRANLRAATKSQNGGNRKPVAGSSSRFKGVVWYKRDSVWQAAIRVDNRNHHLGYFASEEAAARAYDAAAPKWFGEFARLNFPEVPSA
jgi:hypothetical protein